MRAIEAASTLKLVMPGLVPGIHVFTAQQQETRKTWMAGTSSAKTRFALLPGHDEKPNRRSLFC
jgi:hypothetical protein